MFMEYIMCSMVDVLKSHYFVRKYINFNYNCKQL
jgi:hypothetical protein